MGKFKKELGSIKLPRWTDGQESQKNKEPRRMGEFSPFSNSPRVWLLMQPVDVRMLTITKYFADMQEKIERCCSGEADRLLSEFPSPIRLLSTRGKACVPLY